MDQRLFRIASFKIKNENHDLLKHQQTGRSQFHLDRLCVHTSFLIHIFPLQALEWQSKKPLMCQEQTTAQHFGEHGGSGRERLQAVLKEQSTEAVSMSPCISAPHGDSVLCFRFLASILMLESLACSNTENSTLLSRAHSHCHRAAHTKYGAINLSPLMRTKGQALIIHSGCQTMPAGCYLGWGRPIELFRGRILFL